MRRMINVVSGIKQNWEICSILLLALLLRLIGISHSYPYILNIDEPTIVRSTMGLFFSSDINHFDWPHFNYYFHYPFYISFIKFRGLLQILGIRPALENVFPILWNDPFVFYTISRTITAIMSGLAVIPVYLLGKRMFDKDVAIISALFLAICPYLIFNAHFTMQDGVILFWVMWGVLFSYYAVRGNKIKHYLLAGMFFALASGVKYNAVLIALILPLFALFNIYYKNKPRNILKELKKYILPLVLSGIAFIIVFLLSNPLIVIDWDLFWSYERGRGFLWQLKENSNPVKFVEYPSYLIERIYVLVISMGISIPLLFLYSIFISSKAKYYELRWAIYSMSILILGFSLFTSRYERAGAHYYLPIFGFVAILAGFGYISILNNYIHKYKFFFKVIVFLPIIIFSILNLSKFIVKDSRREALSYYQINKEKDIHTYFVGGDFREINGVNNLGMKKFKVDDYDLVTPSSYILSQEELEENDRMLKVEIIKSRLYKRGPIVYVYQIQE